MKLTKYLFTLIAPHKVTGKESITTYEIIADKYSIFNIAEYVFNRYDFSEFDLKKSKHNTKRIGEINFPIINQISGSL